MTFLREEKTLKDSEMLKKMKDEAIARLFELETARKVIKEMENKGVEL